MTFSESTGQVGVIVDFASAQYIEPKEPLDGRIGSGGRGMSFVGDSGFRKAGRLRFVAVFWVGVLALRFF